MPTFDAQRFFQETRDWQWIKHTIFSEYIRPWATIVGKWDSQIWIVDAFAGAGTFRNAADDQGEVAGSPLLAAREAMAYNERNQSSSRRCDVFCVEKEPANFDHLRSALHPEFEVCTTLRQGEYEQHLPEIVREIGSAPLLLLLDPIGLKAISADRIEPLINRKGKTDVFMTLHFGVAHRVGGFIRDDGEIEELHGARSQVENIDAFFRSTAWREIVLNGRASDQPRGVTERRLVDLFFDHVAMGLFAHCSMYPVRSGAHDEPRYWLAHLCDHWKPFWLMNDLVAKVDAMLLDRTYEDVNALPGLGASMIESRSEVSERLLREALVQTITGASEGITFGVLRDSLAKRFFGVVREDAYARNVKWLISKHAITRTKPQLRAKLEDHELLRGPG